MALFSNNISRLFENNPVNQVGPTGQPLIGGSNITDLATRSLGGLLGREVRGRPEQLTAALAQIDPKAPDAEQQQLTILAQLGNPQQQIMAAQKIKANREKAEEKSLAERQIDGYNSIATLARTSSADPEFLNNVSRIAGELRLDPTKVNELIKSNTKGLDTKVVGKSLVNGKTGEVIYTDPTTSKQGVKEVTFTDAETGEEVTQFISETDPNKILREIRSPAEAPEMGQQAQIQLRNANESYNNASSRASQANALATNLEQLTTNLSSGLRATIEESIKGIAGSEDIETLLRVQAQALRISIAVSNLPPGPASDKDVQLVLSGTLPANADPKTLASYARGIAKLATKESKFHSDQAAWISKYKDAGGYLDYVTARNYDDKIAYLNQELNAPPPYNTFLDYAQYLSSKGTGRSSQEELELAAFENEIGESVTNMFERRDSSKRRLKESKRDKF